MATDIYIHIYIYTYIYIYAQLRDAKQDTTGEVAAARLAIGEDGRVVALEGLF